ncbi:uncharacterized protein LOC128413640 isoform X1 [Podarcis raffonei]|uniref:uncharacterized protein LOC128413640 isoform X1 n=1 Tax=Podarcis raffonei TaxID=65483 RepID=UPI0023298CDC|nr:uncharacterized protein LOC128413640 isoform X1 [Podarcis raffonei]
MSSGQKLPGPGSKDRLESKRTPSLSTSQPVDPNSSSLLLTEENVKKLQEKNSASKSALARESIEAFITQSNLFLNKSEASTSRSKEQSLSDEKEPKAASVVIHVEDTREDVSENTEQSSKKGTCILFPDSQTRSPSSSVLESQTSMKAELPTIRCGVTDVETQTEWSYSDMSSEEKRRRKVEQASKIVKERPLVGESEELIVRSILEKKDVAEVVSEESSEDHESDIEDHSETDLCLLGCCEFCATALNPLPTAEFLDERPEKMECLMCCRTYKDIFQCVVQELIENSPEGSTIDITPHRHQSEGSWLENKTKRTLIKEIEDKGGIDQYRDVFEQYIKFGPCMKLRFKLSDYPPKPKKVRKKAPEPKEILTLDLEFKAEQLKICHSTKPVKRYYSDGKIFYLLFPDGTGQV